MSDKELQEEEREVLLSIYDGDPCFKDISPTTYQYKYGVENDAKSFLMEISWSDSYPSQKPQINMNTFYNKHIVDLVKEKITKAVLDEAEQYLGAAMTYTLFEFIKEKEGELVEEQPETIGSSDVGDIENLQINDQDDGSSKKSPKKVQLTKAQKRRQWDKVDFKGEKPRGWNWVDIVKHLSQTGGKASQDSSDSMAISGS